MKAHLAAFRSISNSKWTIGVSGSCKKFPILFESFDFLALWWNLFYRKKKMHRKLKLNTSKFQSLLFGKKEFWRTFATCFFYCWVKTWLPRTFLVSPRNDASFALSVVPHLTLSSSMCSCFFHWFINVWGQDLVLPTVGAESVTLLNAVI